MSMHNVGRPVKLADILSFLRPWPHKVKGLDQGIVGKVESIDQCEGRESLTFCSATGEKAFALIRGTQAGVVVCGEDAYPEDVLSSAKTLIMVDNPRLMFMRIVREFFTEPVVYGIHPSAVIHPDASIPERVGIGANCYIGKVEIGSGTVLHEGVIVRDNVRIGKNVTIFPGTVIGGDGFGYERNEQGELEKFPHIGGVVIEDGVEIGSNACIDRGVLGDTRIRSRARIDNLVHVAHNVDIGEDAAVIALSLLGGSSVIGKRAWIAPSAVIRNKVTIGEHAVVGLGSVVTKDVPDHATVMGNPAKDHKDFKRMVAALSKLAKRPV